MFFSSFSYMVGFFFATPSKLTTTTSNLKVQLNSTSQIKSLVSLYIYTHLYNKEKGEMLQLFLAVAFSAVPLTLYVPPIRSLSLFVASVEQLLRQSGLFTLRFGPRLRLLFSRLFAPFFRSPRQTLKTNISYD